MEIALIIIGITVGAVVALLWQLKSRRADDTSAVMLNQTIEALRQQLSTGLEHTTNQMNTQLLGITQQVNQQLAAMNTQLAGVNKTVGERLDTTARQIAEVNKGLGSVSQATQHMMEIAKDISGLQTILQAPKLRGNMGEFFLDDLLSQILPAAHYQMQYRFRSGEVVDAVIRLGKNLVPVDAKFPLENLTAMIRTENAQEKAAYRKKFSSDVKKHIDAIAEKYILPDEATFDFALMYIPAENVYYETIIKGEEGIDGYDLSGYALSRKVIPVSPNSLYAYLQAIVLGLRGMQIEKSAEEIMKNLSRLTGDFERFREDFEVLGKHIGNIKSKYDDSYKRMERFADKLNETSAAAPQEKLPI